jgi:hypothetical protein
MRLVCSGGPQAPSCWHWQAEGEPMSADDTRLTERPVWDATGMERVPFDGRIPAPSDTLLPHRSTSPKHGPQCSGNPEVGCLCDYDPGDEPNIRPAEGYERASRLSAGQTVMIHGGVRVTLLSVEPYVQTDSFAPSSPWVTLNYRWATAGVGEDMTGRYSLPASQCLRVVG